MQRNERFVWMTTAGLPIAALAIYLTFAPRAVFADPGSCASTECNDGGVCRANGYCAKNGCTDGSQICVGPGWDRCGTC